MSVPDKFARAYVPAKYRRVQEAQAVLVPCSHAPFDWAWMAQAFVNSYAGRDVFSAAEPHVPAAAAGTRLLDTANAYEKELSRLLHDEVMAKIAKYADITMFNVKIWPAKGDAMWSISVPSTQEFLPEAAVGDKMLLRKIEFDGYEYEGIVCSAIRAKGLVFFRCEMPLLGEDVRVNAAFLPNTQGLQNQMEAVREVATRLRENSKFFQQALFPDKFPGRSFLRESPDVDEPGLELVDTTLDKIQISAVAAATTKPRSTRPFLIWGPPGTGKTRTLTETVHQLLRVPDSHILLCAPSNIAADTLIDRLAGHFKPKAMFRLNSPSRTFEEVPMSVLPFCYSNNGFFALPPYNELVRASIIVCTCEQAQMLRDVRFTNHDIHTLRSFHGFAAAKPHFSALVLDEAGQSTEPALLVPLLVVACEDKPIRLIFAGDHLQLGPLVHSRATHLNQGGLALSHFERIMNTPPYREHPLARHNMLRRELPYPFPEPDFANLRYNYRSHVTLLIVSSLLLYSDTLVPCAEAVDTIRSELETRADGQQLLPCRDAPLVFHATDTPDDADSDATSWYNEGEVQAILHAIQSLAARAPSLRPEDIAVIAPFRQQVLRLRRALREQNLAGVNVGVVENYQGAEFRAVFVSTVRSRARFLHADIEQGSGMVCNVKFLNVALSRAKEYMYVTGNPTVLSQDPYWREFIAYCLRHGMVTGPGRGAIPPSVGPLPHYISRYEAQAFPGFEESAALATASLAISSSFLD